jgi:hypothetical protein
LRCARSACASSALLTCTGALGPPPPFPGSPADEPRLLVPAPIFEFFFPGYEGAEKLSNSVDAQMRGPTRPLRPARRAEPALGAAAPACSSSAGRRPSTCRRATAAPLILCHMYNTLCPNFERRRRPRLDKERENAAALAVLPDLLRELDAAPARARLTALVEGVLAANIFDWGAQACVDLYHNGTILEIYRRAAPALVKP